MKKNIIPLLPERFYHVYNRSINSELLFKSDSNYQYFLAKLHQYINPVAKVFAYSLLPNHFHILLQIKTETELRNKFNDSELFDKSVEMLISKQFSNFFNGYAQAFNKMYLRTGGLFEEPFRRKEITSDEYLTEAILYIHLNPVKHGLKYDYREYPYSSYNIILRNNFINIDGEMVIRWFGSIEEYIRIHELKKIKYCN